MNLPAATLKEIQSLVAQNKKTAAIKLVCDTTKCSLKDAKDYVDNLGKYPASAAPMAAGNIDDQLKKLLSEGKKLEAVKLYKDHTGVGLAASKDYVDHLLLSGRPVSSTMNTAIDRILQQQAQGEPSKYNSSFIIKLLIFLLVVAMVAWIAMRR